MSTSPAAQLTAPALDAYLAARGRAARVRELQQIGGGASRETWLVTLEQTDRLPSTVLLRKDPSHSSTVPTSLRREFDVLSYLHEHSVRVAAPLWFEEETHWFGTPFYLREGFEGTSDQNAFSGHAAHRLATELAESLAVLHGIPTDPLLLDGAPVPGTVDEAFAAESQRWFTTWRERAPEPVPFVHEVARWLRQHQPAVPTPPVVVWGDVGVANTVCGPDGSILALSDFELVAVGDPMRDLASALWRGVGQLAGRDTFLDAYAAASGRTIDPERIHYYEVFSNWQISMFSHSAPTETGTGHAPSLHPSLLRIWIHHINLHKAGRLIGV